MVYTSNCDNNLNFLYEKKKIFATIVLENRFYTNCYKIYWEEKQNGKCRFFITGTKCNGGSLYCVFMDQMQELIYIH